MSYLSGHSLPSALSGVLEGEGSLRRSVLQCRPGRRQLRKPMTCQVGEGSAANSGSE